MKKLIHTLFISSVLACGTAQAQLTIEIAGAGANRIPVAVADFAGEPASERILASVIRADLETSGLFKLIPVEGSLNESSAIDYYGFKDKGADAVVAGSLSVSSQGRQEARYRLYDVNKRVNLSGAAYLTSPTQLRAAGHRIADDVYEKLTGEKGVFSTRIAYVTKSNGRYQLQIADADGQNAQAALVSKEPIISPTWSPEGGRIAYVSFENKKPVIYVHALATGKRHTLANFKGSNSAPTWAPSGRQLAIVLTKDGHSQIYAINVDGSGLQRLSKSSGIDTEPRYSPDGNSIYFTSDRGGSPQIYRMSSNGGDAQRVTFEGAYNVSARPSPNGKNLAFITRRDGAFQLAVMDIASRQVTVLTNSRKDESPSFSPNGRMILIATEIGGRGVLSSVSIDGVIKQKLSIASGDVREPAWAPYSQ